MVRHLKKYDNCNGCKAYWCNDKTPYLIKCSLGYPLENEWFWFGHCAKPTIECPKPMQWRTYDKSPVFLNV